MEWRTIVPPDIHLSHTLINWQQLIMAQKSEASEADTTLTVYSRYTKRL